MVWGKILACWILVLIQTGAWILLILANGIAIQNAGLILGHVGITSLILILLRTLTALHYRERTAAQFIFSTGLVVVILLALAIPANPLNLIARLSIRTAGPEQWLVLAVTGAVVIALGYVTFRFAERVGRVRTTR